ncbi:hypothetical protein QJS04_geneDACA018006 [Acorus gramineus]|uniref:Uncharacterized protein n=1 Tax=Acorus gramineus TaxID=55184 RepID=A0AAV9A9I4_ACOGR|nr:hypothetical protein QJS04_geneDACA018006 [Acorus gramineus]
MEVGLVEAMVVVLEEVLEVGRDSVAEVVKDLVVGVAMVVVLVVATVVVPVVAMVVVLVVATVAGGHENQPAFVCAERARCGIVYVCVCVLMAWNPLRVGCITFSHNLKKNYHVTKCVRNLMY